MGDKSAIEWTDATWNPIIGCSVVSTGCTNCYAMRMAGRLEKMGQERYAGLTVPSKAGPVWTGAIRQAQRPTLLQPLRWARPRRIFVNSMGDLFHENSTCEAIDQAFAVMALTPQHTYQVLTKRGHLMRTYMNHFGTPARVWAVARKMKDQSWPVLRQGAGAVGDTPWPLPNVWLGVSVEHGGRRHRLLELSTTAAARRFASLEPLLGPIELEYFLKVLDWVIVGGESGPGARPMHPDWARGLRDECVAAGVPFFFKQWGEWAPVADYPSEMQEDYDVRGLTAGGMIRVGKRRAGAELDGREWREMPA